MIQLLLGSHLVLPVSGQEVFCHVSRQDVLQQNAVEVLHGLDLLTLLLELVLPQEVQPTVIFSLLQEDTEVKRREVTELLLLTKQYSKLYRDTQRE